MAERRAGLPAGRVLLFAGALLATGWLAGALGAALAETEVVTARAEADAGFARLVFDWSRPVPYRIRRQGERAVLSFAAPGSIDLEGLRRQAPEMLAGIEVAAAGAERTTLSLDLAAGARIRHFRDGTSIVVDLLPPVAALAPPKPRPPVSVAEVPALEPESLAAAAPRRLLPTSMVPMPVPKPAALPPAAAATAAARAIAATVNAAAGPVAALADPAGAGAGPAGAEPAVAEPVAAGPARPGLLRLAPVVETTGDIVSIRFPWAEPTAAAVFERAGTLWVVFERRAEVDLAPIAGIRQHVVRAEQAVEAPATVLRLGMRRPVAPVVSRDGPHWLVSLQPEAEAPLVQSLEVRAEPAATAGARIFLPAPAPGPRITLHDPEVGDRLEVIPLEAAPLGLNLRRDYLQFSLLASAQGIAVAARSERLIARSLRNGAAISAAGGLLLSARTAGDGGMRPALFHFQQWRGPEGRFVETRQALLQALAESTEGDIDLARRDLARFYFANGLAAEAAGVIGRLVQQHPQAVHDRGLRALRGAVQLDLGRLEAAAGDLLHADLAADPEAALWRGALAAANGDWLQARDEIDRGNSLLHHYPAERRHHFRLLFARAHLASGDLDSADATLAVLDGEALERDMQAEVALLRGRLEALRGNDARAAEALAEAMASGSRPFRVRAALEQVDLELRAGELEPAAAIERLERLRHAWRGDDFEFALMRRLGDLHIQSGHWREALMTWRRGVTLRPDSEPARRIAQDMSGAFARLFLEGEADRLPPVEALGLFYDFRELTPVGARGDEMIRNLADRMAALDLLQQAAELIDHQVRFRLTGEEKARVAARLAVIRLLDRQPEAALEALRSSRMAGLPAPLARERRHLEARALAETGESEAALALLDGDASREAELLRAEMFRQGSDWAGLARSLTTLLGARHGKPEPLTAGERQQVLQLAVALALAGDTDGIERLRGRYGARMEGTGEAAAFRVLTAPIERGGSEFRELAASVAGISQFEAFMTAYRERLRAQRLSALN